jgi:outer membrane protein TolC
MKRYALMVFAAISTLQAEVHTLTLRQSVDLALRQNPEVLMARLDQQRAELSVRVARDPFVPKVVAGSGAAYTTGYPMSIEGSAPSIIQAKAIMAVYNQSQRYVVAQAQENVRGSQVDQNAKRDEIAHRTATLYLDTLRTAQSRDMAQRQVESLQKVAETVAARVAEGRELPVQSKRAQFDLARARQAVEGLMMDADYGEGSLAVLLGFGADDRVRTLDEQVTPAKLPETEEEAMELALAGSRDIKRMESQLQAKGFEMQSYKASRLPTVDLVAQYALFARYSYQDYFGRFQRNNGQLGASITIPLFAGAAARAQTERAEVEGSRIRVEINNTRERIRLETRKSFQDVKRAQTGREVAKADLDLTREQLSVSLAQFEEGRATLREIEDLRAAETQKWIAYYTAQQLLERAQLNLLHHSGTLIASLQ